MIKCFIIAAETADGFIAKDKTHAAFWTSKEDKARFVELTKKAGVVVMGSQTFKTLPRALKERRNIVYSRSQVFEDAEMTTESPIALLDRLESEEVKEVAICGGSDIYTMFAKAGLVDTIYLTVEPILFGSGIKMFNEDLNLQLKTISEEKTPTGTILLEYRVLR